MWLDPVYAGIFVDGYSSDNSLKVISPTLGKIIGSITGVMSVRGTAILISQNQMLRAKII